MRLDDIMKNKEVILWTMLLTVFAVLVFATPAMESRTSGTLWTVFIFAVIVIALIKTVAGYHNIGDNISKQSLLVKMLFLLFVATAVYDIINYNSVGSVSSLIILLLVMVKFMEWLLKKEES